MALSPQPDWSKFSVKIPIRVEPARIAHAWTSQQGLESWFLRQALFFSPTAEPRGKTDPILAGDTYRWKWYGWPDSVEEQGHILPAQADEIIRFQFGKAGVVSVRTSRQGEDTIVELYQEEIPVDEGSRMNFHVGCKTGWTFYLLNMKSVLLGGLDLRNRNNELSMD